MWGGHAVTVARTLRLLRWVVACVCACALALASQAALADGTNPAFPGSTLHVSIEGPLVAHAHVNVVAAGANAPQSDPILYGLTMFAIDHKQLPVPCSQSSQIEETTVANDPPAAVDLTPLPGIEGLSGPFTISVPVRLAGSGDLLICAYSLSSSDVLDGGADAAWASTEVTISATGSRTPVATSPPRITRSGNRLRCSRGSWSGAPKSYAYRWRVISKFGSAGRQPSPEPEPQAARARRGVLGHCDERDREHHRSERPVQGLLTPVV